MDGFVYMQPASSGYSLLIGLIQAVTRDISIFSMTSQLLSLPFKHYLHFSKYSTAYRLLVL
jgi:hypothetical protein